MFGNDATRCHWGRMGLLEHFRVGAVLRVTQGRAGVIIIQSQVSSGLKSYPVGGIHLQKKLVV